MGMQRGGGEAGGQGEPKGPPGSGPHLAGLPCRPQAGTAEFFGKLAETLLTVFLAGLLGAAVVLCLIALTLDDMAQRRRARDPHRHA